MTDNRTKPAEGEGGGDECEDCGGTGIVNDEEIAGKTYTCKECDGTGRYSSLQRCDALKPEHSAIEAALRFVDECVVPRKCDNEAISACWRCQTVYLASVVRRAFKSFHERETESDMTNDVKDTNGLELPKQTGLSAHIDANGPTLVLEQYHYDNADPVEIRLSMAEARKLYAWLPGVLPEDDHS